MWLLALFVLLLLASPTRPPNHQQPAVCLTDQCEHTWCCPSSAGQGSGSKVAVVELISTGREPACQVGKACPERNSGSGYRGQTGNGEVTGYA